MNTKDIPLFTLVRFNPRRAQRGAEAAEVEVTWPDGETETLWMSKNDLRDNAKEYGSQAGLTAALAAYRHNTLLDHPCQGTKNNQHNTTPMITKTNQLDAMPIILSGDGYELTIDPNAHVRKQTMLSASAAIAKVTTNDESGDARVHLSRLAAMRIEVERCRKEIKEPVLRVGKLIDQAAKDFLSEIELEECRIKGLIGDHANEVARLKAIAEAEERKAFEFARQAREAAEETGRITDVLAHKAAVAAKLAASNEVASTNVAQGVRFAWDFEIENIRDVYKAAPMFVSLEIKRTPVLLWLKEMASADEDVVGRAALLGIFAFKKPVISAR